MYRLQSLPVQSRNRASIGTLAGDSATASCRAFLLSIVILAVSIVLE